MRYEYFDRRYTIGGRDLYADVAEALALPRIPAARSADARMRLATGTATMSTTAEKERAMKTIGGKPAKVGDVVQITGHTVGDAPRAAEILEVLGGEGHEHFRVRWEDGHESIYFPGVDAVIRHPEGEGVS